MARSSGSRLGPYEILSALGAGGMGEVYRARDTKLNRDVALKILPDSFTNDAERVARFLREARVLASLNHPQIGAIYGLEESDDVQALVLELVEGVTLADRIAQGPIPLDETLPIAKQIACALEAAHEQGIVHRDLKPANIKLRPDGTVKVLDFGLATAAKPSTAVATNLTTSPTIMPPPMTVMGVILGTAAYMSPEQARGTPVDTRTDIWAFGCVAFEMLTGRKPFDGETLTDTVAAIVKNEPDWHALPAGTPLLIRSLIARCLRKDPAQRLHDIADGRFLIEEAMSDPAGSAAVASRVWNRREWAAWIAAGLSLGAALVLASRPSTNSSSRGAVISVPVFPPERTTFSPAANVTVGVPVFAISPDGSVLVFSATASGARPTLWLRAMDRVNARQLAGTEGATDVMWSPDSRWIGFFADRQLKKIPAAGGPVQVITQTTTDVRGGTWGADDTILFGSGTDAILSVNAAGGKTTPVTIVDTHRGEVGHRFPYLLPDGQRFLYTVGGRLDHTGVYAGSLDGTTKKALIHLQTTAVYAPPGYLLFVNGDTLLGQAFDAERLELNGRPFLVAEHVGRTTGFMSAASTSRIGTIAYASSISQGGRLEWIDRRGNPLGSPGTPEGDYVDFRLSPDERRLAASLVDPRTNAVEIWLTDLARGATSRLAFGGLLSAAAVWSPDGSRLFFRSNRNGTTEILEQSAAGGGDARAVLTVETNRAAQISLMIPTDCSPKGGDVLFSVAGNDLWVLPRGEQGRPEKLIATPADEMHGNFSPDGHLVAYTSNVSGRFEVYVETIPLSDRKWPVSTNGGYEPRWRADGREIYYLSEDRKLMAVSVGAGPSFGIPTSLFQTRVAAGVTATRTHYVPSRDGQRFLVNMALDAAPSPITVVLNWTAAPRN